MTKEKILFERYVKNLIELVLDSSGQDRVYEELGHHEPKAKKTGRTKFFEEYIPAKLALGCSFWRGCCQMHQLDDKDIQNAFFKGVMKRFETPNSVGVAARFSEYLYASNANPDEAPALAIIDFLFNRLQFDKVEGDLDSLKIAPGFFFMAEVSDALKNVFENEFDDFIRADEDFRVS